jgi:hypothetical protein
LPLVLTDDALAVGDEVELAGFPSGWADIKPVYARGVLSGQDSRLWVNADASWGNSGGPVCARVRGEPCVVGVLLGRAGSVRGDLNTLVGQLKDEAAKLTRAASGPMGGFVTMTTEGPIDHARATVGLGQVVSRLAMFIDVHFRSGYADVAPPSAIRALLP